MKIKILLYTTIVAVGFSCTSFLDEVNHNTQSAEALYATRAGYESLVIGCYASLKGIYNSTTYLTLSHVGTDLGTRSSSTSPDALNSYTSEYTSSNGTVGSYWNTLYSGLKNFNAAIERSADVITTGPTRMDPALLAQRVSEVKVMRALYLFELVRNFGQAPLITVEYKEPVLSFQYADAQAFYTQILDDLSDGNLDLLPWKQTGASYGRVSRAAGKHLRALVYLTRGYLSFGSSQDFTSAYNDATDVVNNSGHELLDDYMMVHRLANQRNNEVLFNIGFANQANYNNSIMHQLYLFQYYQGFTGLSNSMHYSTDWGHVMPTKYAYMQFDWMKDRRASVTFMSPVNGNEATSSDGTDWGQNFFEANIDVDGLFEAGDTCLYFPVPTDPKYKTWTDAEKQTGKPYQVFNYPTGDPTDMSPKTGENDYFIMTYQHTNTRTRAWLPVWKFKDSANTQWNAAGGGTGTRNTYVFRLAETCLIAAEAAVKLNNNANALTWINKVRARAAVNAPEAGLPLYTGTVTLDHILDERGLELLGETSRWSDLQRTGLLAERVLKYNWDTKNIGTTQLTQESFINKFNLRPIPLAWLNSIENGDQLGNNPGW